MEKKHIIVDAGLLIALMAFGGYAWSQSSAVERLEERLALVDARVEGLEQGRPAPLPVGDVVRDTDAADRPLKRGDQAPVVPTVAAQAPATPSRRAELDTADPVVRSQLREMIEEQREIEREERDDRRSRRQEERTRERMKAIATKTEMDATTTERVTDLLLVEQAEAGELFRQARESMDWEGVREKMEALRTETDSQARDLMDEDEFAEYESMREEELERFRGRGPQGGRGPGRAREAAPEKK